MARKEGGSWGRTKRKHDYSIACLEFGNYPLEKSRDDKPL